MTVFTILSIGLFVSLVSSVAVPTRSINCTSVGDPHITTFPGGRTDLYSPGVQIPGDFLLARFCGVEVSESHQPYAANPAVYVNFRVAVSLGGNNIMVSFDTVSVNYAPPVTPTSPITAGPMTVTRTSPANYIISFPQGFVTSQGIGGQYMNLLVSITDPACPPTGGLCGPNPGPHPGTTGNPAVDFAQSWHQVFGEAPFGYTSPSDYDAANPTNYQTSSGHWQTEDQALQQAAQKQCAAIMQGQLAQQCQAAVESPTFFQACLDDVIATKTVGFAGTIVDDFVKACVGKLGGTQAVLPTSALSSTAEGPGIQAQVPAQASSGTFVIVARDAFGNPRTVGGDVFTVSSIPATLKFTIVDQGNGLYRVTYNPIVGNFAISVQKDGNHIIGSSFKVLIR